MMLLNWIADTTTAVPESITAMAAILSLSGNIGLGTAAVWVWRQYERLRAATVDALRESQAREDRAELREDKATAREQVYLTELRRLAFRGVGLSEDLTAQVARAEQHAEREWAKRHGVDLDEVTEIKVATT